MVEIQPYLARMNQDMNSTGTSRGAAAINVFAVIGFLALIIVGLWSSITLIEKGMDLVGVSGSRSFGPVSYLFGSTAKLSIDNEISTSETPVRLSWVTRSNDETFSLTYSCRDGVFIKVSPSPDSVYAIPCNAPYQLPTQTNEILITPVLGTAMSQTIPLTLTANNRGSITKDTKTLLVEAPNSKNIARDIQQTPIFDAPKTKDKTEVSTPVTNSIKLPTPSIQNTPINIPAKTETPKALPKPITKTTTAQVNALPPTTLEQPRTDLHVRVLSVGSVDANGKTKSQTVFSTSDTGALTFEVINKGTTDVQNWNFSVVLPTGDGYLYTSPAQKPLVKGAKATLTINFDHMTAGSHVINIHVDPRYSTNDMDRSNNETALQIVVIK